MNRTHATPLEQLACHQQRAEACGSALRTPEQHVSAPKQSTKRRSRLHFRLYLNELDSAEHGLLSNLTRAVALHAFAGCRGTRVHPRVAPGIATSPDPPGVAGRRGPLSSTFASSLSGKPRDRGRRTGPRSSSHEDPPWWSKALARRPAPRRPRALVRSSRSWILSVARGARPLLSTGPRANLVPDREPRQPETRALRESSERGLDRAFDGRSRAARRRPCGDPTGGALCRFVRGTSPSALANEPSVAWACRRHAPCLCSTALPWPGTQVPERRRVEDRPGTGGLL